jgi:integrase
VVGTLSALAVQKNGPGVYSDGGGLYLCVSPKGRRYWIFRFSWGDRRPEMGLGGLDDLSLAEARDAAAAARRMVRAGVNPIEARRAERREKAAKRLFGDVADDLFEAKSPEWRNAKHADQWRSSLETGAVALRGLPVDAINTDTLLEVLKPIWAEKPETASRLRQRIEAVLDAAKAQGLRSGENPARWRGHLEHLLPKRQRLARGHFAALPYADLPTAMARLRIIDTPAARALEFAILTAARSGEVYGATWPEVDLDARLWTIPAERTKPGRVHRIPIPDRAAAIVEEMKRRRESDFIFPGQRRGKPLSHIAMSKVLERLQIEATVHGMRSAFRDWAGNETDFPREVAEAALGHVVGDAAERAYRRGDALEKRRAMMDAWASFLAQKFSG